ncbi:MAG: hypothetical protein GXZ07_02860 [Firmicutes bacterium]|nr:hypothetical protein [Bacillota bacterium]
MKSAINRYPIIPFILRYIALHTLTYLSFGIFFMLISQYARLRAFCILGFLSTRSSDILKSPCKCLRFLGYSATGREKRNTRILEEKVSRHLTDVYLVNTGWSAAVKRGAAGLVRFLPSSR